MGAGPRERAARLDEGLPLLSALWDGACVYREQALDPGDVRDMAALVGGAGRDLAGYDIKVSGNRGRLAEFAAAGPTWWGQWITPGHPEDTRKSIAAGPPSLS
jgi:hypothetical protein